jgi:hypothetical protein
LKKLIVLLLVIISLYGCKYREPIITEIPASIQAMNRRKEVFYNNNIFYKVEDGMLENIEIEGRLGIYRWHLGIFGRGSKEIIIYEDGEKKWKQFYKVKGIKSKYISSDVNDFKFKLESFNKEDKLKVELEELTEKMANNAEIPEIKSIEYNEEKVEFQEGSSFGNLTNDYNVTQIAEESDYEIKIVKNKEEIGRVIMGSRIGTGVFIRKGTDEEMKKFLFKCAYVQIIHKRIKESIQEEFD